MISKLKFFKGNISVKNVGEVMVLVICKLSDSASYLYQICENVSKGFRVIERTRFPLLNLQRGIIPSKMLMELWFLFSARRLIMLYICIKFHKISLPPFRRCGADTKCYPLNFDL